MIEWEYEVDATPKGPTSWSKVQAWLNEKGAEGWELVAFDYGGAIFKRQKRVTR